MSSARLVSKASKINDIHFSVDRGKTDFLKETEPILIKHDECDKALE